MFVQGVIETHDKEGRGLHKYALSDRWNGGL
jgi:hypothetical protein